MKPRTGKKQSRNRARAYALLKENRFPEARKLLHLVCKDNPADTESWFYLGALSGQMGAHGDAIRCFQKVIAAAPGNHQAHYNLGIAQRDHGLLDKAATSLAAATRLSPGNVNAFHELGLVQIKRKHYRDAATAFEQVIKLLPGEAASYSSHADACLLAGDLFAAIASLEKLAELKPKVSSVYSRLGDASFRLGKLDSAIEHYRHAARLEPTNPACGSKLLSALNFSNDTPLPRLFTEARRWGMLHSRRAMVSTDCSHFSGPDHKIRIGYIFSASQLPGMPSHIAPLLLEFDRSRFEVFCYSDRALTEIDTWPDFGTCVADMEPSRIAEAIMKDGIDILVDISGHEDGNMLAALTVQPAPLQISYLGYPYTTGLPSVQYRITDGTIDPESDTPELYTEQLLRLDRCTCYYRPENPEIQSRIPEKKTPGETLHLGVVAKLASLNDTFLTIASKILSSVKHVEFHIINADTLDDKVRKHARAMLDNRGIPGDIIHWHKPGDTEQEQLALYEQLDLLLDTTPVCGFTAICQSLWMGVPVITLSGERPSSRIGKSILEAVGLPELVTNSDEELVRKAIAVLEDRDNLASLHGALHQKMLESSVCDSSAFIRSMENLYTKAYKDASSQTASA